MYISDKKKGEARDKIVVKCGCNAGCIKCLNKLKFLDCLSEANIPFAYWFLRFTDFRGHNALRAATTSYMENIVANFKDGHGLCFAGQLGTGKTYSLCSILKSALIQNYTVYYTTLSELVFYLNDYELKKEFYSKLIRSDFLCIDEIDSRHMADTEHSVDFFGRNFERILRYRSQNKLPTLMATNNVVLEEAFSGQFKKVIGSLADLSTVIIPAIGLDHRLKRSV